MYEVFEDGLGWYVKHIPTGKTLPYHSKFVKYAGGLYSADWDVWFSYSNNQRKKAKDKMKNPMFDLDNYINPPVSLGNCQAATPYTQQYYDAPCTASKQEGNNPMYNKNILTTSAMSINIPSDPSDEMKQRDYLLSELREMTQYDYREGTKVSEMKKLFNLDAPIRPKTSQEIIDAFKNGKVVIDQAKVDRQTAFFAASEDDQDEMWVEGIRDQYYGVTFTDLPVADLIGYKAAYEAYQAEKKLTERTIHIATPADGLKALLAFEAWMPTPATTTVQ